MAFYLPLSSVDVCWSGLRRIGWRTRTPDPHLQAMREIYPVLRCLLSASKTAFTQLWAGTESFGETIKRNPPGTITLPGSGNSDCRQNHTPREYISEHFLSHLTRTALSASLLLGRWRRGEPNRRVLPLGVTVSGESPQGKRISSVLVSSDQLCSKHPTNRDQPRWLE